MIGAATVVFIVAFVLDTGAVVRLFWACLVGHAGQTARIVAFGILLLLALLLAVALCYPRQAPTPKVRKKATRRAPRNDTVEPRNDAVDSGPRGNDQPARRRRRKSTTAVVTDTMYRVASKGVIFALIR